MKFNTSLSGPIVIEDSKILQECFNLTLKVADNSDPSKMNFTWEVSALNRTGLNITVAFLNPLYISNRIEYVESL